MRVKKMTELDIKGKRVLIREDLNVPMKDGRISNDNRIRAALPTIEAALQAGAGVLLMSHLGRPTEGEWEPALSLEPIAKRLSELLGKPVRFEKDYLEHISNWDATDKMKYIYDVFLKRPDFEMDEIRKISLNEKVSNL